MYVNMNSCISVPKSVLFYKNHTFLGGSLITYLWMIVISITFMQLRSRIIILLNKKWRDYFNFDLEDRKTVVCFHTQSRQKFDRNHNIVSIPHYFLERVTSYSFKNKKTTRWHLIFYIIFANEITVHF